VKGTATLQNGMPLAKGTVELHDSAGHAISANTSAAGK
jgi:hypothetical protein